MEPNAGPELTTLRLRPELRPRVRCPTNWAIQVPLHFFLLLAFLQFTLSTAVRINFKQCKLIYFISQSIILQWIPSTLRTKVPQLSLLNRGLQRPNKLAASYISDVIFFFFLPFLFFMQPHWAPYCVCRTDQACSYFSESILAVSSLSWKSSP